MILCVSQSDGLFIILALIMCFEPHRSELKLCYKALLQFPGGCKQNELFPPPSLSLFVS